MSVRHAVLALLAEGPKYGLKLRQEFEERTGEVWPLNVGQVYTTLQRLERDGLVTRTVFAEVPPRVVYELTEAGETLRTPLRALEEWSLAHFGQVSGAWAEYDERVGGGAEG